MRFIQELKEGSAVKDVYLCKQKNAATTKNGKEYYNVILQDKTGTVDAKVWEPNSFGIADFEAHDYVFINGDVTSFPKAPNPFKKYSPIRLAPFLISSPLIPPY